MYACSRLPCRAAVIVVGSAMGTASLLAVPAPAWAAPGDASAAAAVVDLDVSPAVGGGTIAVDTSLASVSAPPDATSTTASVAATIGVLARSPWCPARL